MTTIIEAYYTNFSLFCRLKRPYRINTSIPTPRKIRFLEMIPCQMTWFILPGILKGFRNTFHWVRSRFSDIMSNATPIKTITTAVPFPFFMSVENINAMEPINTMGYISWYDISKIFTLKSKTEATPAKRLIIIKIST
jgi:hypothetical protein